MKQVRVLIVDDSAVVRELLTDIVGHDPRLAVAGAVGSGEEALQVIHKVSPDVISMDIRLPGMSGFEATRRIMAERPTPIVVVSNSIASEELEITMNALRAGALTVIEKPVGSHHAAYRGMAEHLCTQLAIMSEVRVVRQRPGLRGERRTVPLAPLPAPEEPYLMIGMVASTGGPSALVKILAELDRSLPVPVLLVQHISATFLEGFVSWLAGQCRLEVVQAGERERPMPGRLYVAPADRHLAVEGAWLRLLETPPVDGQRPSGTVLLRSMASVLGPRAIGVVLTGMGADGAAGLLDMQRAGAHTIAEHASTAVVYGMPGEAAALGAARELLPLSDIGPRLRHLTSLGRSTP
ncbi:MAG: chemotaxis-specific protein-glutamate methyltransferase CheB [Candidatus Xenobia bacterium]